jgi:hypothetical protein
MWPPWVGEIADRANPPPRAATQGRPYRIPHFRSLASLLSLSSLVLVFM